MDRHTIEHERQAILRSIEIAQKSKQYHEAGARRDDTRRATLEARLAELDLAQAAATHDCTCD